MKWFANIIGLFSTKLVNQVKSLSQKEIDCIISLAISTRTHRHKYKRVKAIKAYQQALDRGVPLRSNIYMDYMAEVDHPCPDLRLRHYYRQKICAEHEERSP